MSLGVRAAQDWDAREDRNAHDPTNDVAQKRQLELRQRESTPVVGRPITLEVKSWLTCKEECLTADLSAACGQTWRFYYLDGNRRAFFI